MSGPRRHPNDGDPAQQPGVAGTGPQDVIFEPLGTSDVAFRSPSDPAPRSSGARGWIDLTADQPEIVIEPVALDDLDFGPIPQPAANEIPTRSRFDAPANASRATTENADLVTAGVGAESTYSELGFHPAQTTSEIAPASWDSPATPRPFDSPLADAATDAGDQAFRQPGDEPTYGDGFFDNMIALPPAPSGSQIDFGPDRTARRGRLPMALRLALPILAIAACATALVFVTNRSQQTLAANVKNLEAVHRLALDNAAAEGTLLRSRRAIERTVTGSTVSATTASETMAYLEERQLELDRFEDTVARELVPKRVHQKLVAAYADDHAYLLDSIAVLKKAVTDPKAALAALKPNVETFYGVIEAHRDLGTSLDNLSDTQSSAIAAKKRSSSWPLLIGAIGLPLLGILAAINASRAFGKPLRSITRAVNSVADGDLTARSSVSGRDQIGRLGFAVDTMASSLTEAVGHLEDDARRGSQNRIVFEALDIADSESEVHRVAEQAMGLFAPQIPGELLLSEQTGGRLWRVASSPTAGAPGCNVESPASCFALRRGQTVIFESADSINSCPKLRNRPGGPCSAVCIPVSFSGQALGVLHSTGPDHDPPEQATVDQLVDLGSQLGARIGTLRTLESTRLQAATDGLTGLPNRRMIEQRVAELLADRIPFVLILADLDRFKSINDRFGHEVGDRSLQLFSRTLQDNVRDADLIARHGGEEFVIVYPEMTVGGSMEAIERLRLALITAQSNSSVPGFTCSFGVTHSSVGTSFDEIFRVADAGLLVAKEMGRNRSIYADRSLADRVFGQGVDRDTVRNTPGGLRATLGAGDDDDWTTKFLTDIPADEDITGDPAESSQKGSGRMRRSNLGQTPAED